MAQPPGFSPATFADKSFDSGVLADLDTEFTDLQSFVDAVRTNLAAIQRDDTKLKNGSVHKEALASETLALFAAAWNPRGAWATSTSYAKLDVVEEGGSTYLCTQAHTSGTFATDESNGLWLSISGSGATEELIEVATSGTSSAYTASTGSSYSALADIPPLMASWHTANAKDATLNVDGTGAKQLKTVGGNNVSASDLTGTDLVAYNAGADAYRVIGREGSAAKAPAVKSAITAHKTLTDSDLLTVSHYIQQVDISAGSGTTIALTLPAAANNANRLVTLAVSADAGEASDNKAQLKDSGGNEIATLFQTGDFATFASDGTSWVFVDERMTIEVELALTASETVGATSTAKVFDVGTAIVKNIGKFWDGTTNHRFDFPGTTDSLLFEVACVRAAHADVSLYPKHSADGAYVDASGLAVAASSLDIPPVPIELASGENLSFEAYNDNAGGQDLFGDTNKDETRAIIRCLRRLR